MTAARAYLDHNATSPVRPEVAEAMRACAGAAGQPVLGPCARAGRRAPRWSRRATQVAALVGAKAAQRHLHQRRHRSANARCCRRRAVATAGAPRADAPAASARPSIPACCDGHRFPPDAVEVVPVDGRRRARSRLARRERLARAARTRRALVSVHAGQQRDRRDPAGRRGRRARPAPAALLHGDAVQAAGKIAGRHRGARRRRADPLGPQARRAEGRRRARPPRPARSSSPTSLMRGGGQERGWRAGTENVPGIAGFGAAAEIARRALGDGGRAARGAARRGWRPACWRSRPTR